MSKGGGAESVSNSQLRLKAVTLFEVGYLDRELPGSLGKLRSWVAKWKARWRRDSSISDRKRSGRPKVLSTRGKKLIDKIKYKRCKSVRNVAKELKGLGNEVSHVTVWNYIKKEKNWKSFKRPTIPYLTDTHQKKRLAFARKYEKLSAQDWENFVFSDECLKYLFHKPNKQNDTVWGSQEDNVPPVSSVKNSAKVMVWGAMGAYGLTKLHIIPKGKSITSEYYVDNILTKELKPALSRRGYLGRVTQTQLAMYPGSVVFVQDGAPPHTSARSQTWLQENVPNFIPKEEWPGNSPDLNPIENLWSIMDNEIYKDPIPKTMTSFRRRLHLAWARVSHETLQSLIHSMPDRLKNVIKNKGGPSYY